jgi:hypothetical protein
MESIVLSRICENCNNPFNGRRDKKYCSSRCRSDAHNQEKAKGYQVPLVRNITNALLKNREVMRLVLAAEVTVKATRKELEAQGFNFKYCTNTYQAGERTYFYSYDYGYMPLKDDWCLLVRLNK